MKHNLIYKEEVYQLGGLLFDVYKELRFGFQEKYYTRAFEQLLIKNEIKYDKEVCFPIYFKNKLIGRYFFDFLIDDKIIMEFKVAEDYKKSHIQQILAYLNVKRLKLGLLVIITRDGIKFRRVVN